MSHINTSFDPDIDSFLNLDQAEFTPATTSPNIATPALAHQSSTASSSHFASSSNTQTFAGPSFQYDAYRQQTGLPVGGLANTFAVNQNSGLQHYDGQGGFVMPNETINLPLSKVEDFDFNRPFDFNDMDFEEDSPSDLPTMFYPSSSSSQSQFVSPTTLVSSNTSPSTSTPIQRIYPGMHSQAAQAKAQQAQQKQQEMIRRQQQARQIPGQKPLPKTQPTKDPEVEESISRILSQMRQKSVSSADDDTTAAPSISNVPRLKKDEDDMDEDELLLASEEGKKLSSKERRQLRNKVSARAFRSRRKGKHEYFPRSFRLLTCCQNTSANLKEKLPPRLKKPTLCVLRTVNCVRRTPDSLTSLACFSLLKPLPDSSRSSIKLVRQNHLDSNLVRSEPNHSHSQPARTSIRTKRPASSAPSVLKSAWHLYQNRMLTSLCSTLPPGTRVFPQLTTTSFP
jgi:hypothetical protein